MRRPLHNQVLNEYDVRHIRALHEHRKALQKKVQELKAELALCQNQIRQLSYPQLAKKFEVSKGCIEDVITRHTFKYIE